MKMILNAKSATLILALGLGLPAWGQGGGGHTIIHQTTNSTVSVRGAIAGPNGVYTWSSDDPFDAGDKLRHVQSDEMLKQIEEATRAAMQNADEATRKAYQAAMDKLHEAAKKAGPKAPQAMNLFKNFSVKHPTAQAPVLVVTSPMENKQRAELQEDLRVMEQVLQHEFKRVDDGASRQAMGIRIWMSERAQPAPMYVEGYGTIFSFEVDFPLAGAEKTVDKTEDEPGGSAWDRAKRQVHNSARTNVQHRTMHFGDPSSSGFGGGVIVSQAFNSMSPTPFDPERVEALVNALSIALGEAKNIRHLKPSDAISLTISGADDTGAPLRLTLKVTKDDVDRLAAGKITAEEFRKKVVRNLG